MFEAEEGSDFGISADRLDAVVPNHSEPETIQATTSETHRHNPFGEGGDPGLQVVVENLAPNRPELHVPPRIGFDPASNGDCDIVMSDQLGETEASEKPNISHQAGTPGSCTQTTFEAKLKGVANHGINALDHRDLQETATASLREHEAATQNFDAGEEGGMEKRHDSHQEQEPPLSPGKDGGRQRQDPSPLKLDTMHAPPEEESIATSPTLSKHVLRTGSETLPAIHHHSHAGDGDAGSPSLPPIRQIVTQTFQPMDALAEAATQQAAQHHSPPLSSVTAQSPGLPYHPYPGSAHMSPTSQPAYSAQSPRVGFGDPYGSPSQYSNPMAYYTSRRTSAPTDRPPGPPPSIPSVSSSGDSHGHASSIDGYSTAHTTPTDQVESTPRPILPPPPGMMMAQGYKCDWPDCPAAPFQTQYLLRFVDLTVCTASLTSVKLT